MPVAELPGPPTVLRTLVCSVLAAGLALPAGAVAAPSNPQAGQPQARGASDGSSSAPLGQGQGGQPQASATSPETDASGPDVAGEPAPTGEVAASDQPGTGGDATVDAAPTDPASVDASPTDAAPTDATPTDAAPTDGTPTNAAPTDAGLTADEPPLDSDQPPLDSDQPPLDSDEPPLDSDGSLQLDTDSGPLAADYNPLRDSPEAIVARRWLAAGIAATSVGAALVAGGLAMGLSDPCTPGNGNNCFEDARNRAALTMGVPGGVLLVSGIAMTVIGAIQRKRLRTGEGTGEGMDAGSGDASLARRGSKALRLEFAPGFGRGWAGLAVGGRF